MIDDKVIWWRTCYGDWMRGTLLAITEEGLWVDRTVPWRAYGAIVGWGSIDAYTKRTLRERFFPEVGHEETKQKSTEHSQAGDAGRSCGAENREAARGARASETTI